MKLVKIVKRDGDACGFRSVLFLLTAIRSKMGICGYYGKKFCYIVCFNNNFMKMAREVNFSKMSS